MEVFRCRAVIVGWFSNYSEPKRYDMIGENNTFFLHPGESIPLIFKFLSFSKEKKSNQDL